MDRISTEADARALAAAAAVDGERLWRRLMSMAEIGATPRGGVNRQAFSPQDAAARRKLADWGLMLGFKVSQDGIGNLFLRRLGSDPDLPPVLTGSHLDSQPTGGKFDGAYGVIAGFEVLEAIERAGIETRRSIELVAWSNEEGSRFQPGAMGSGVFSGRMDLDALMSVRGFDGKFLEDCLDRTLETCSDLPLREGRQPVGFYVEAHIEQGPLLEKTEHVIGVVTGIQGQNHYRVELLGEEAHAGTTPHIWRHDALQAALRVIDGLNAVMADPTDTVRFTVGRMEVEPGSPNTVPGRVAFTIDLRHPDGATLKRLGDAIPETADRFKGVCEVRVTQLSDVDPTHFDRAVVDSVRAQARALNLTNMEMISGAGHDAMYIARIAPSGMIFIPCERGISHNEAENASPDDCEAGARVLAATLVDLATR